MTSCRVSSGVTDTRKTSGLEVNEEDPIEISHSPVNLCSKTINALKRIEKGDAW